MLAQLDELYTTSLEQLKQAETTAVLETWHKETLGRKGSIYLMTRQIGSLSAEERPLFGQHINKVKNELEAAYENRLAALKATELQAQMDASAIDVTLPGRKQRQGGLHVATQTLREIYAIWADMGFQVYRSRDVETD
ncbi:MAG: phenylalanine--tRNA ligase subunit alpha, partial [Anaerolineae bacterium]|nr:phenylalanine--tRNA ligase subunit alpha [Anaerolineae bacterium]